MRIRSMITLMTLLVASAALLGQSRQENWKQCKSDDPDRSIAGCSALIQSHTAKDADLAEAFNQRGLAYLHKGSYDDAIRDFDQALRLKPRFADAFHNRGTGV